MSVEKKENRCFDCGQLRQKKKEVQCGSCEEWFCNDCVRKAKGVCSSCVDRNDYSCFEPKLEIADEKQSDEEEDVDVIGNEAELFALGYTNEDEGSPNPPSPTVNKWACMYCGHSGDVM